MTVKTKAQLTTAIDVIRNETTPGANTESRVATMLQDIADANPFNAAVEGDGFAYARVRNAGNTADLPVIAVNPTTGEVRAGGRPISDVPLYRRKTQLDEWLDGGQNVSPYVSDLLSEATVICPLRAEDRYYQASDTTWRSRNYGLLGDGMIVGTNVQSCEQLPYSPGRKGVRLTAGTGVGMARIPYAWIDPDGAFTLLIRYQKPAASNANFSTFLCVGDVGGGSATGRVWMRTSTTDIWSTSTTVPSGAAGTYNPRVVVITGATGAGGAVKTYFDGVEVASGTKNAGTLSAKDHPIGGMWSGGVAYGYANWNILDVIVIPRTLTAAEASALTLAVQHVDEPDLDFLTGQSNMVGPASIVYGDQPAQMPAPQLWPWGYCDAGYQATWARGFANVQPNEYGGYGPELTIAVGRQNKAMIKSAAGGQTSVVWTSYSASIAAAKIADGLMAALLRLSCRPKCNNIVYYQGEADAVLDPGTATSTWRRDNLITIASVWRTGLGRSAAQCRVVVARIPIGLTGRTAINATSLANVRAGDALFVAADANAVLVDLDGVELKAAPDVHNSSVGTLDVGARIAAAMQ